jgi:hypothetical protein
MNWSLVFMWTLVLVLGLLMLQRKGGQGLAASGHYAKSQATGLIIRLPMALAAGAFLAELLPEAVMANSIGPDTGIPGILLASVLGGFIPGGPMISFPMALFIWQGGAGTPQIVALMTGWSVFAFHRVLAYETPMMGWRFSALRLTASCLLPPIAGLLALAVTTLVDIPITTTQVF